MTNSQFLLLKNKGAFGLSAKEKEVKNIEKETKIVIIF
jgi:hypothetical protein